MPEAAVRLDLAHGSLHAVLSCRDEDLLEREEATTAHVPDQIHEREAALAKQPLDLVLPPVDFERCVTGVRGQQQRKASHGLQIHWVLVPLKDITLHLELAFSIEKYSSLAAGLF